jgi:hypothetical protein
MTTELSMQAVPRNIFNGMGHNETAIPGLEVAETFDTVETVLDSAEGVKDTRKQNILKRLVSRKKKGTNASKKKKTRGRSIIGRISRRMRSKSKARQPKKFSGANTVASEEVPTLEEKETSNVAVVETAAETEVVFESAAKGSDVTSSTPVVDESVEVSEVVPCCDDQETANDEIPSESEESDSSLEIEASQDEVIEEILVEKASFHNDSSDYVGLALVAILAGLLASPMFQV